MFYGGGEGNRTPVRRSFITSFYECSCCFNSRRLCRPTTDYRFDQP